jgi:hypothetical protein
MEKEEPVAVSYRLQYLPERKVREGGGGLASADAPARKRVQLSEAQVFSGCGGLSINLKSSAAPCKSAVNHRDRRVLEGSTCWKGKPQSAPGAAK